MFWCTYLTPCQPHSPWGWRPCCCSSACAMTSRCGYTVVVSTGDEDIFDDLTRRVTNRNFRWHSNGKILMVYEKWIEWMFIYMAHVYDGFQMFPVYKGTLAMVNGMKNHHLMKYALTKARLGFSGVQRLDVFSLITITWIPASFQTGQALCQKDGP